MPQIYDMGPTALLSLRRKACWEIFPPKNPTASAGFEPANLGTKGQHATPRPPKQGNQHRINIVKDEKVDLVVDSHSILGYVEEPFLSAIEYTWG